MGGRAVVDFGEVSVVGDGEGVDGDGGVLACPGDFCAGEVWVGDGEVADDRGLFGGDLVDDGGDGGGAGVLFDELADGGDFGSVWVDLLGKYVGSHVPVIPHFL